jgi:hypothetical protein
LSNNFLHAIKSVDNIEERGVSGGEISGIGDELSLFCD